MPIARLPFAPALLGLPRSNHPHQDIEVLASLIPLHIPPLVFVFPLFPPGRIGHVAHAPSVLEKVQVILLQDGGQASVVPAQEGELE